MSAPLHVSCLSLLSAVGITPPGAAAAMRGGLSALGELPFHDSSGEPIIGAVVPDLPRDLRGRARLIELLVRTLEAALPRLQNEYDLDALPVLLCTREPQRPGGKLSGTITELESRLRCKFRREGSAHFALGQTACYAALGHIARLPDAQRAPAYLIAAVDSLLDARTLHWLDEGQRLRTSAQRDGLIPGEAAGLLLVTDQPVNGTPYRVAGLGHGTETATVLNEEPLLGKGLADAVRMALGAAELQMHEIDFRLSDVGGESYAFEELVLAQTRVTFRKRESQPVWLPAMSAGDCGAATVVLAMAWAEQAYLRGYAPGPRALLHASAAGGSRAAAVMGI